MCLGFHPCPSDRTDLLKCPEALLCELMNDESADTWLEDHEDQSSHWANLRVLSVCACVRTCVSQWVSW